MQERILIWMDMLGFKALAEEIAKEKGVKATKIRLDFIDTLEERLKTVEDKGEILGKSYSERDEWLIVTSSLDLAFKVICEILDHNSGYENYEKIPMEIGISIGKYDKWATLTGPRLIVEEATIEALKTKIIGYYHSWYRLRFKNQPKNTFVVLTSPAYERLEPLDKTICTEIKWKVEKDGSEEVLSFFVADINKFYQRGKVHDFLEEIGHPSSKLYDRIDSLYIPPFKYEELREDLERDRVVFIIGTGEFGKTYTAVRLLWEYFTKGYKPLWILGGEESERRDVRARLEEIERELRPHMIVYFEDPFGKTRYEARENLEREIGTIIDCIKKIEDVYVVITSREEVFKEFLEHHLASIELKELERKLNLNIRAYDYSKRKEILLKWAEAKGCKWMNKPSLKRYVLKQIHDEKNLPTPLSIRDFAISTREFEEKVKLSDKIRAKSQETARSFAQEIKNMTDDKILLLAFPFISSFQIDLVKTEYTKLIKELKIRGSLNFDEVFTWFRNDKLSVINGKVMFSHPSYSDALSYVLVKNGHPTRINREIFSKVLFKLSDNPQALVEVAQALKKNLDTLTEKDRSMLLIKLAEESWLELPLASFFLENFNKFADDIRYRLLAKFSKRELTSTMVAEFIVDNFDRLPEQTTRLLLKVPEDIEWSPNLVWTINTNFDKLPKDFMTELLIRIGKNLGWNWLTTVAITKLIISNFDRLPEQAWKLLDNVHIQNELKSASLYSHVYKTRLIGFVSKFRSKIPKDIVRKILSDLIDSEDREISKRAKDLMLVIKKGN